MAPTPPEDPRQERYTGEELSPFDVRDYSDNRSMRLLLITLVLMFLIALVAFQLYYGGTRDRDAPPRLAANDTPIKVTPDDTGGNIVPDQDKIIYDKMSGEVVESEVTHSAQPEEPVERQPAANIVVKSPNDRPTDAPSETYSIPAPQPITPPVSSSQVETPQNSGSQSGYIGSHVVQIASVRTAAAADDTWGRIRSQHGMVFPEGSVSDIKRVNLPEKGIYYRIRIAGLSGKPAADGWCNQLKARGQACFVTRP